jgi:hypothetical protein
LIPENGIRENGDIVSTGTTFFTPIRCKEERAPCGALFEGAITWALRSESGYDVGEDVLDLVAHRKKDHDDHD